MLKFLTAALISLFVTGCSPTQPTRQTVTLTVHVNTEAFVMVRTNAAPLGQITVNGLARFVAIPTDEVLTVTASNRLETAQQVSRFQRDTDLTFVLAVP